MQNHEGHTHDSMICFQDELSRFSDTFTSRRQLNQIFFLVFSLIAIYVDTIKAKRPPKMNKIARISVCDILRIDLIKIEIIQ